MSVHDTVYLADHSWGGCRASKVPSPHSKQSRRFKSTTATAATATTPWRQTQTRCACTDNQWSCKPSSISFSTARTVCASVSCCTICSKIFAATSTTASTSTTTTATTTTAADDDRPKGCCPNLFWPGSRQCAGYTRKGIRASFSDWKPS